MDITPLLKVMVDKEASDLFITAGVPPSIKVHGKVTPVGSISLTPEQTRETVYGVMDEKQQAEFEQCHESNFAIYSEEIGRFRVSAFYQCDMAGMVLRRIETEIPDLDDLKLPDIMKDLSMTKRGLIIVVGGTGTGKSTSLAAMIGHRNQNSTGHIISIEDPIEFVHKHGNCIISQREVGLDTGSFEIALKNTLRQAPDVIMIGEIRTKEVMDYAVAFAETGHLCLATLHANNANQALDRIIRFFPGERHSQLLMDLSLNLKAVIAQQLIPDPDGQQRHIAVEILLNTPLIADIIRKGEIHELKELMTRSTELGMQTFDQALYNLYQEGKICYENALAHADSVNDLRLRIKLDNSGPDDEDEQDDKPKQDDGLGSGLSLQEDEPG